MRSNSLLLLIILTLFSSLENKADAQQKYKVLSLPENINSVNEEYSGMALLDKRLYLMPQYGNNMQTRLNGKFEIYSISTDSLKRIIKSKDQVITKYRTLSILNLDKLPDSLKTSYEGFEAITFIALQVYLSIETVDSADYCYLIKGKLDTIKNTITIDPDHVQSLKRYPFIKNAGFESLSYLPKEQKLMAMYEFNGMPEGGIGYLIDPSFSIAPKKIAIPYIPFRITDSYVGPTGKIYAVNYHYGGDYDSYLNNNILRHEEQILKRMVPELKDSLSTNPNFLKDKSLSYARIVMMNNYKDKSWKHVRSFNSYENNWEGLVLFEKGAFIITDANRNKKQLSTFAYLEF
jgi:hypothetical protein